MFDDHIWVEIPLANADRLLCGCIYRSPTKEKGAAERSTNQVCNIISEAINKHYSHLLICGDFNYPDIEWENESVGENSEHLAFFVSRIQENFLPQHISEPTRYRFGEEPSLLDLVLTNEECMVLNLEYQS